ncbi:hypothetical protein HFN_1648 [Helicobacter fennelliae MRY12-0050]|uniref:Uncharacterized protein n=1 Tax=Helicobacter fennelliae MRY12-0050 TaxID=1325130 RepID=T1CW54_9HELI|nr:hypothetical protein HFN_1648 [Helicobacter fennelliae MRY12-0050]
MDFTFFVFMIWLDLNFCIKISKKDTDKNQSQKEFINNIFYHL